MGILRFGQEFDDSNATNGWNSPYFRFGDGGVAGLWLQPARGTFPATWDKAGYASLSVRSNPNQVDFRLQTQVVLFNRNTLFMFPNILPGNEFRLELDLVEWISSIQLFWGTVLVEAEEEQNLESVIDSLQVIVAVVQALL